MIGGFVGDMTEDYDQGLYGLYWDYHGASLRTMTGDNDGMLWRGAMTRGYGEGLWQGAMMRGYGEGL